MQFLQDIDARKDVAHPSHKFPIKKRRAKDEAVNWQEVAHDKNTSYILGRQPTADPTAENKMNRMISLSEQDGNNPRNNPGSPTSVTHDGVTSIPEDAEDDNDHDVVNKIITNDKISTCPPVKPLKKTESVWINNAQDIELNELKQQRTDDSDETLKSWQWNVGFVIRIHDRGDKYGFTERIAKRKAIKKEDDENFMMSYGPYRSSFKNIIPFMLGEDEKSELDDGAIILIATGAGAAYMIDTVLYLRAKFKTDPDFKLARPVRIHFSARSIRLFQWMTNFFTEEKMEGVKVFANLTSHKHIKDDNPCENAHDKQACKHKQEQQSSHAKIGRASFKDVLKGSPHNSKVFFTGHPKIQASIKVLCKELHFTFYEGHSFG